MVQIITDSSSLYTKEEGIKAGIVPIPLFVNIVIKIFGIWRFLWRNL